MKTAAAAIPTIGVLAVISPVPNAADVNVGPVDVNIGTTGSSVDANVSVLDTIRVHQTIHVL